MWRLTTFLLIATLAAVSSTSAQSAVATSALKIVVIDGEGAVNVIQQRSAVAPVVEVRDRNNQPVAGAVVRFAVRSGRATFSGARNFTAVTNAAGRAASAGLVPTGNGALQISATAAFQGQTAAITIAQTNVMTAVEAAAAASGGSSGAGAATGSAAGGSSGGGLSAATIGVAGGAAAGGVIAAKELGLIGGGTQYSGAFSGTSRMVFPGGCTRIENQSGTLEIEINEGSSTLDGTAHIEGKVQIGQPNPCGPPGYTDDGFGLAKASLSGSLDSITFTGDDSNNFTDPNGASGVNAYRYTFAGALVGDAITGTLTVTRTISDARSTSVGVGTVTYSVILRR